MNFILVVKIRPNADEHLPEYSGPDSGGALFYSYKTKEQRQAKISQLNNDEFEWFTTEVKDKDYEK